MNLGLNGKIVLITGTNNPQGIGFVTALSFINEGAKVVLVYKKIKKDFDESKTDLNGFDRYNRANAGDMKVIEKQLKKLKADYYIIRSDITNEGNCKKIFDAAEKRYGKVDILINNAAVADDFDTIETVTKDAMDQTFDVNVKGGLLMSREFVKRRGNYGRIINLSTDSSQAFAGQITYGASKAAVEALTRSIAMEVAKYGITVNCVAPGPTQTGWIDEELEKACNEAIPMGKLVQPQDVADVILFLASERAAMVTGQVIKVNGGHVL